MPREENRMKTAVVFYSMSGNVRYVADKIAGKTDADLIVLEPEKAYPEEGFRKFFWGGKSAVMGEKPRLKAYDFTASAYDLIVLGTPVWAGTYNPCLRSFIYDSREQLKGKTFAAFCCHSGGGGEKTLRKLREALGIERWKAELSLVDPKDRPDEEKEAQIEEFCAKIQEEHQ